MRIVSLISSATEIVCALGRGHELVGRSHECDFPAGVTKLPSCTEPKFDVHGSSVDIAQRVRTILQDATSVYRVHADLLTLFLQLENVPLDNNLCERVLKKAIRHRRK